MITQVQQDMENRFYDILKEGGLGREVIEKYPNQTPNELADTLTDGLVKSYIGGVIEGLDQTGSVYGFGSMCKTAFNAAVLRLLNEAKEESEVTNES